MKPVKDRDGFNPQGAKDARFLDDLTDAPFLKRRRAGGIAMKRGGFLETRLIQTRTLAPFLWGIVFRAGEASTSLVYRRYGWKSRRTIDTPEVTRAPAYVSLGHERYIGGGYVLQMVASLEADGVQNVALRRAWLSLIAVADKTGQEVAAPGLPGQSVSFHDAATLPIRDAYVFGQDWDRPHVFATGHDANPDGFAFGFVGRVLIHYDVPRRALTVADDGIAASIDDQYAMRAWRGNTATRQLTAVELRGADFRLAPYMVLHSPQPGRAMALATQYTALRQPDADSPSEAPSAWRLSMLRTDDHGRTWATEAVPELQALMCQRADGSYLTDDAGAAFFNFPGLSGAIIAPLDTEGRCCAVVNIAADPSLHPQSFQVPQDLANYAFEAVTYFTRWGFFVSDTTGRNWTRRPWPLDDLFGGLRAHRTFFVDPLHPVGTWGPRRRLHESVSVTHTAGPGTFFVGVIQEFRETRTQDFTDAERRVQIVSTVDGGLTWATSPYLPPGAFARFNSVLWPIVARPYKSEADPGEVYLLDVDDTEARTVRIYRTSALFLAFDLVYEQSVPGFFLPEYGASRISGQFIGDKSGNYPARLAPGFPGFDQ
jgi:hypothetical protein